MYDYHILFTLEGLISLIVLAFLEIVLGIDNIIFISLVAGKLPKEQQAQARNIGLSMALIVRCCLLFSISFILSFQKALFMIGTHGVTGRDLILLVGGVFLLYKTIGEIREKFESKEEQDEAKKSFTLNTAIAQIIFIDIVFSFDSILTAVGMVDNVWLMVGGVVISMFIMMAFSAAVSDFIEQHPTMKMLALAFLLLIGMVLILDAAHIEIEKPIIFVALAFALLVEGLNMALRSHHRKKH
ncbi:MAG: TerC family protein [Bacteroidia bacterium]|nr:TerC family protein [Bacteroidia bacterium]